MDLINKEVSHKRFGKGRIVNIDDSFVEVHFEKENKKFVFPDAFGKFLKLHDEKMASSINKVLEKKKEERERERQKKREARKREWEKQQLRMEREKLMRNLKLHPQSQVVFWCDEEEHNNVFTEWQVFTGIIKSGKNKGTPRKISRIQPNSACLLTVRDSKADEKDRRIIGAYLVPENFIGKLREDGYIPAHPKYRLTLTEEESNEMLFWKYYLNKKYPHKTTWNTGKYRYFDNIWMAQILRDIISLKKDPEEKELAQQFFDHFCKLNEISTDEIPEPNGALLQTEN